MNETTNAPQFLGIGTHQAGSNWIYDILKKHPEISFPGGKEIGFWARDTSIGISWYEQFFPPCNLIKGEISPLYQTLPNQTIARCHATYPNLKLFFIYRDPIKLAWSIALKTLESRNLDIKSVTDEWFIGLFEDLLKNGVARPKVCVENWLRFYPPESLLIIDFEDLIASPRENLRRIARHIGTSTNFITDIPERELSLDKPKNESTKIKPTLSSYFQSHYEELEFLPFEREDNQSPKVFHPPSIDRVPTEDYLRDFSQYWFQDHEHRRLNLECGDKIIPGWLNADSNPVNGYGAHKVNISQKFPFADSSFDCILLNHALEKLPYHKGFTLLNECHRILRPGGAIRIATIDWEFMLELYNNPASKPSPKLEMYTLWYTEKHLTNADIYSPLLVTSHILQHSNKQSIYDKELLTHLLSITGFKNVTRHLPGESKQILFQDIDVLPINFEIFTHENSLILEASAQPAQ